VKVITIAAFVRVRRVIEGNLGRLRGNKGSGGGRAKARSTEVATAQGESASAGTDYAPGKGHAGEQAAAEARAASEADQVMETTDPADLSPPGRGSSEQASSQAADNSSQALTEANSDRLSGAEAIIGAEGEFDEQVGDVEQAFGASAEQGRAAGERYRQDVAEAVQYPEHPKPEKPDQADGDHIAKTVDGILGRVRESASKGTPSGSESPDS